MRKTWKAAVAVLAVAVLGLASYWGLAQQHAEPSMARLVPQGAVLFVETADLSKLLTQWTSSSQQKAWLNSDSYRVFSQSRMFLRLQQVQGEFESAAGLPPDMGFVNQVAGEHSALAIYDIGKLELLYITRLPSARSMQSMLWQKRAQFNPRQVEGKEFYVRSDQESGRVVAFAVSGEYLLLATREDLIAGALSAINGKQIDVLASEAWYAKVVEAAKAPGELRMAIKLGAVAKTPQFRTYWIQQNITDSQQYESALSDLYLSGIEYREERVLTRAEGSPANSMDPAASHSVAELMRLVPQEAGFYQAVAAPGIESTLNMLETKVLTPRLGPASIQKLAPSVSLGSGTVGSSSDLETRIDMAPVERPSGERSDTALQQLLTASAPKAVLQLQRSEAAADGIFVKLRTTLIISASREWDDTAVRAAIQQVVSPGLTTSGLGAGWKNSGAFWELDGLEQIVVAANGKYLIVSNDAGMTGNVLGRMKERLSAPDADYVAGFNHATERENFYRLTGIVDRASSGGSYGGYSRTPEFFSENVVSLSKAFSEVQSQTISIRREGAHEFQTVRYQWMR